MNRAVWQTDSDFNISGWAELTCQEYQDIIDSDLAAKVASSLTDPDGIYGSPLTYTLWELSDGRYLATALEGRRDDPRKCSHAVGVASPKKDEE